MGGRYTIHQGSVIHLRSAAGITIFNPNIERLKLNIDSIIGQVDRVYTVNNGSENTAEINELLSGYDKITHIENEKNEGIARALNQMCAAAFYDGFDWILTLDQDSIAEAELIKKYSRYTEMDGVAIITPYIDDENEPDIINSTVKTPYEPVHRCYTSASFTKLSVWNEVGGFDDDMFIDCVDFDYCTAVEEAGYIILRDNEAVIKHCLGRAHEVRAFMPLGRLLHIPQLKRPMYTYNHPPLRTYYYARNIKYYTYKHRNSIDRFTEWRVYIKWLVLKLFFEDQKWAKLKAIIKGRHDGRKMIKKYKEKQKLRSKQQ